MTPSRVFGGLLAVATLGFSSAVPAAGTAAAGRAAGPAVTVYKSSTCGCCKKWVDHLRTKGFVVTARDMEDMDEVKASYGVPAEAQSCHTAVVGGYVVEGHVPADVIAKLLREKPKVAGIAAPGMPVGSPGMEVPGTPPDRYDVVSWTKGSKSTQVYAKR